MTCLSCRLYTSTGKLPIELWVGCSVVKTVIKLLSLRSDEKIFQISACSCKWHDFTPRNVSLSKNMISQQIERCQCRHLLRSMKMKWTSMNKGITKVWSRAWFGIKNAQAFLGTWREWFFVTTINEPIFPFPTEQGATADLSKSYNKG